MLGKYNNETATENLMISDKLFLDVILSEIRLFPTALIKKRKKKKKKKEEDAL